MGVEQSSEGRHYIENKSDILRINVKITPEEFQTLKEIVHQRSNFKSPYLCTVSRMLVGNNSSNVFCQNNQQFIIEYEPYEYLLSQAFRQKPFPLEQIQRIIFGVGNGLIFLFSKRYRHGDIQSKCICNCKGEWKLLDNIFIKRGISAYEKVLEGQDGFISPSQMQKIRHGFVRESPPIEESDEVFALGMTCLELMTGRYSKQYYKQSYIRFNENILLEALNFIGQYYPLAFVHMVRGMVEMNETRRITLRDIMSQPFIARHSRKYSLRPSFKP